MTDFDEMIDGEIEDELDALGEAEGYAAALANCGLTVLDIE